MFRKTLQLLLGEDQLAIGHHLEDATSGFDILDLDPVLLLQLVRQTGGSGLVVSLNAVFDGHTHHRPSFLGSY